MGSKPWVDGVLFLAVGAASGAGYLYWRASNVEPSPPSIVAAGESHGAAATSASDKPALPTERTPLGRTEPKPKKRVARARGPQRLPRRSVERAAPSQQDIEDEMRHIGVTMYSTRWCPVCAEARQWMSSNGYRFSERDVDADESAKEARDRLAPRGGVPVFVIGGQLLDGFSPDAFERTARRAAETKRRR